MPMGYTVYMHRSPSDKVYIGITKQKVERRWRNGAAYKHCIAFYNAIQKYGWDNIEHIVLASGLSQKEAAEMEQQLIKQYDSTNPKFGYNIRLGGECGGCFTEESRRKMREAKLGEKAPRYGLPITEYTRQRLIETQSKKVAQFTLDGEYIRTYNSGKEAAIALGNVNYRKNIYTCRSGKIKSAYGFIWRYAN